MLEVKKAASLAVRLPSTNMPMIIRFSGDRDRKQIIELLRASLGESTIPKSEELWSWKHDQNPFGSSYVLVAEQDGELIGVRAFMKWQFHRRGKLFKVLRAVDTVTHPAHKGKGIFKKLTLQLVDRCKADGYHFIFNTPNEQSLPGYLKMGWMKQARIPLKLKLLHPCDIMFRKLIGKDTSPRNVNAPYQKWTKEIFELGRNYVEEENLISTRITPEYLSWRYGNNPLFRYSYFTDGERFLLIGRLKMHSFGTELRITDFLRRVPDQQSDDINRQLRESMRQFCSAQRVDFISMSHLQYKKSSRFLQWMGWMPALSAGPLITLRNLNMPDDFQRLMKLRYWNYSLGDLELF